MFQSSPNLLILSLAYPPATGGCATYTQLLTKGLIKEGFLGNIIVLVEGYPDSSKSEILNKGQLKIIRLFPFHSELSRRNINKYFKYIYQNFQLLSLPFLLKKYQIDLMLVHTHYYYSPSFLPLIIKLIRKFAAIKLIADVRDPKLSLKQVSVLKDYDKIICCAENVLNHLSSDLSIKSKLNLIPIPFEINQPCLKASDSYLNSLNLKENSYLFSAGGILAEKNIHFTLKVVKILQELGYNLPLVVAGKKKSWTQNCQEATDLGYLKYIGVIPHKNVLKLASKAALVLNLSQIESPSRYILEAIAVGAKVLLPPNIPEFLRSDPDKIVQSDDPQKVAQQIINLLEDPQYKINYNLDNHSLNQVISQYLNLFSL